MTDKYDLATIIIFILIIGSLISCSLYVDYIEKKAMKDMDSQVKIPYGYSCYNKDLFTRDCYVSKDYSGKNGIFIESNLLYFRCYIDKCYLIGNYSWVNG